MSIFGDNGASDTISRALQEIQAIPVPTADSMKVQLQKLVQMGVLAPDQVQAYLTGPNAYDAIKTNPLGTQAQVDAIQKLQAIAAAGGMDDQEYSDLQNVIGTLNANERGRSDSILQDQAQRGTLSSGMTLAARLQGGQSDAENANKTAVAVNAARQGRTLDALKSAATMGQNLEGQQFGEGAAKATAANAIDAFNAQQKAQAAQWNASNNNAAKATNLSEKQRVADTNVGLENQQNLRDSDLSQQEFQDKLAKSGAAAGTAENLAKVEQADSAADASFIGNLLGATGTAGGNIFAAYLKNQNPGVATGSHGGVVSMEDGGTVPGKAAVPGDSPRNDRVPALLSPGEIVVPRTAAASPDRTMEFLNRLRRPKPTLHPEDVATVLKALHHVRQGV